MQKREITLADGRYLIFFTFDDEEAAPAVKSEAAAPRPEPQPQPEAEEKSSV